MGKEPLAWFFHLFFNIIISSIKIQNCRQVESLTERINEQGRKINH